MTWTEDHLAVAIYAYLYGLEELGYTREEILRLTGLTRGQWETRLKLDLPAQDGQPSPVASISRWRDIWFKFKAMPKKELGDRVQGFLSSRL